MLVVKDACILTTLSMSDISELIGSSLYRNGRWKLIGWVYCGRIEDVAKMGFWFGGRFLNLEFRLFAY